MKRSNEIPFVLNDIPNATGVHRMNGDISNKNGKEELETTLASQSEVSKTQISASVAVRSKE